MKQLLTFVGVLVLIWLVVGAAAAFDRGYFDDQDCATTVDDAEMVAWGPLSYLPALEFNPGACVQPT